MSNGGSKRTQRRRRGISGSPLWRTAPVVVASLPVPRFVREDPADPVPRIGDVARVAGDHMHMGVVDGLAGVGAHVDSDVEPGGTGRRRRVALHYPDQVEDRRLLVVAEDEEVRVMATWHHQGVAGRDREPVAERHRQLVGGGVVAVGDASTERTVGRGGDGREKCGRSGTPRSSPYGGRRCEFRACNFTSSGLDVISLTLIGRYCTFGAPKPSFSSIDVKSRPWT